MTVVLSRVDNRLIHGQVIEAWAPRLNAEAILVVDRELPRDAFQKMILEGMGQGTFEVRVTGPEEGRRLLEGKWKQFRVIVLYPTVAEALAARREGLEMERLNLGNVHPNGANREINDSVHLSDSDVRELMELLGMGVAVEARALPGDSTPDVARLIGWGGAA
jgi:PTS system mannose-specific IIB component